MSNESINSSSDAENQRHLDHELKDMISHLSFHVSHLRQAQDQNQAAKEEDNGVRIITVAGTNTGATMKSELGADPSRRQHHGTKLAPAEEGDHDDDDDDEEETEGMGTLVNSNFQAVNNSIMLGGSFSSNDPGVKVEISGDVDHPHHQRHRRHGHRNTKGKERIYQPIAGSNGN